MKTYLELQDYLDKLILKKRDLVEVIMYSWMQNSYKSKMFIYKDDYRIVNISMAEKDLILVKLYDLMINPSKSYNDPKSNYYDYFIKDARKKVNYLNLNLTVDEITNDFFETRIIMKKLFQDRFCNYGIELDEKMLSNIFGETKSLKEKYSIDTLRFFTRGTHFNHSLSYQFGITMKGQASGIFSSFFMRAAGHFIGRSNNMTSIQNINAKKEFENNPFYHEKQTIKILATAVACCYK